VNISTKTKIFIASVINKPIAFIIQTIFRTKIIIVKRFNILWKLDITEGIDFSIYLFGSFERETSIAIKRLVKNNSIVIDIGANIGAHTLPIARLLNSSGKVFAIEPTSYAYSKLKENIKINKDLKNKIQADQILLINGKNTNKSNQIYSSWPLNNEAQNKHSIHQGVLMTTEGSSNQTLDNYLIVNKLEKIDLIKIDVDGNEFEVLSGAKKTLKRYKPPLIMELAPEQYEDKSDFTKVVNLLLNLGYVFYSLNEKIKFSNDIYKLQKSIPKNGSINVIARISL
jgi:FkbM family methyltransferase